MKGNEPGRPGGLTFKLKRKILIAVRRDRELTIEGPKRHFHLKVSLSADYILNKLLFSLIFVSTVLTLIFYSIFTLFFEAFFVEGTLRIHFTTSL